MSNVEIEVRNLPIALELFKLTQEAISELPEEKRDRYKRKLQEIASVLTERND